MSSRRPKLQVVVVGRARPPHDAPARLYEERAGGLIAMRVDEVAAEGGSRDGSARRREGARLAQKTIDQAWRVALDPGGRTPKSSDGFARWLEKRLGAQRPVAFWVGGADGLDPDLVGDADEVLSLGPLTMPHQLARVVLAEQVYRALCIMRGHPYAR